MAIWTIDFETFFDSANGYTLKKMTTEAYVRDPRFKVHTIGLWSPTYLKRPVAVKPEEMKNWIHDGEGQTFIAHNAAFDGLILAHHFGIRPKGWIDTLSMARAVLKNLKSHSLDSLTEHFGLHEKTIDYKAFDGLRDPPPGVMQMLEEGVVWDVALTAKIASILLKDYPKKELRIIDQYSRMFTEPAMTLDAALVRQEYDRIRGGKEAALAAIGVAKEQLASAAKLCEILTCRGVDIPMKQSPTTPGKLIPALGKKDEGMKSLLDHPDPYVAAVAAARLEIKSSLQESACERLLAMHERGPLCVSLKYSGAHTHRVSSFDKINWLNFTRGSALRKALVAPDGFKFIGADSAQIEARFLNWKAGQDDIVQAFRDGTDIYSKVASMIYGRPINKKENPNERHLGKVIELSAGYRTGWVKVQSTCKVGALGGPPIILTEEEARRAVDVYRRSHPKVVALWEEYDRLLKTMLAGAPDQRKIMLPSGLWLDYSEMTSGTDDRGYPAIFSGKTKLHGGVVTENVIQATARVFMTDVIDRMMRKYPEYKLVNFPYDELLYLVPENDNNALNNLLVEMKTPSEWCADCPVDAEGWEGKRYSK